MSLNQIWRFQQNEKNSNQCLLVIFNLTIAQLEKASPSPVQPYEGLKLPIPTPEQISPALLEMPPNSWPNEAFSLTGNARAFLIRGTQYPLSPWPGSEISQVMGGTVDTRSSVLPPTSRARAEGEEEGEGC